MSTIAALIIAALLQPRQVSLSDAARGFDHAQTRHDRDAVAHYLANDFVYINRQGRLLGKSDFIAITTGSDKVANILTIKDHRILPLGSSGGVVSGMAIIESSQHGGSVLDRFRYVDVFARRGGRWTVVCTQVTALSQP